MKEQFIKQYNKVFDANGCVKACGRNACSELIETANKLEKGVDHGNSSTGMMNIPAIKHLMQNI